MLFRSDEWSAGFESVESTADGLLLVDVITINRAHERNVSSRGYESMSGVKQKFETDLL